MQGPPSAGRRTAPVDVSIVIPAFDEAERIAPSLKEIAAHLSARPFRGEVLLVDDGSRDGTAEVARQAAAAHDLALEVLRYTPNRGKGHAVRTGMLAARGEAVLFTDADLSVPVSHLDRFLSRLHEGADVVIGSRRAPGANIVRHQPAWRERLGTVFRDVARLVLVPGVDDFTCGFKLFRAEAARAVFSRQRVDGWGFDVEIALIARRLGLHMVSEPVQWSDDARTRVRIGRDALRSAWELARVRWHDLRGAYGPEPAVRRESTGSP